MSHLLQSILGSVHFWGRKCVKTTLFYSAHRAVSPFPSGPSHAIPAPEMYRVVQKKGTVLLSTSLVWPAVAAGQKLSLNLAPFLLLNPVHY